MTPDDAKVKIALPVVWQAVGHKLEGFLVAVLKKLICALHGIGRCRA